MVLNYLKVPHYEPNSMCTSFFHVLVYLKKWNLSHTEWTGTQALPTSISWAISSAICAGHNKKDPEFLGDSDKSSKFRPTDFWLVAYQTKHVPFAEAQHGRVHGACAWITMSCLIRCMQLKTPTQPSSNYFVHENLDHAPPRWLMVDT